MRAVIILIILITSICTACEASQPSSPAPSKPIEIHRTEINQKKSDSTITQPQLGTVAAPLVVKVHESISTNPNSNGKEEKHKSWFSPEWVLIDVTLLLVVVTALLALYTYRLWCSTNTMAREATNTADRQAREMKASLEIAKDAANAAMIQAQTSTESLKRSNRAWIGVTGKVCITTPLCTGAEGKSIGCCVRLAIINIGTSPALNTSGSIELVVSQNSPIEFPTVVSDKFNHETLLDNLGVTILPGETHDWVNTKLNCETTSLYGKVYVWLKGHFLYKDQFGDYHHSSFLFSYVNTNGTSEIHLNGKIPGKFEPIGGGWENT